MVKRYKFNLLTYVQSPLMIGRRSCTNRDFKRGNGGQPVTDASIPVRKAVTYESDVTEYK